MAYKTSPILPMQRLLQLLKLEKQDILLLIYMTMAYGVLGIATPVAVQTMVNLVTMGGVLQPLYVVGLMLFCLLSLSGALYATESYLVEMIQRRIFVRSSFRIAQNTQQVQIQVYDNQNPVELVNRYFDITTIQKSAATLLTIGLTALLQGVIGSLVLLFYSVYFGILVIIILIILWAIVVWLGKQAEYTAVKESKAKYKMAAWLENIARNMHLFKFYQAGQRAEQATSDIAQEYLAARTQHFSILMMQLIGAVGMYALIGTAMLVLGGTLVIQGQINLGQFVASELIIFGVLSGFVRFVTKLEYFYDMLAAIDKLSVLEDLPIEETGQHLPNHDGYTKLNLHGVGFAYQAQRPLIQPLDIHLQRGQSLAILGHSGMGKSTLVELIAGLRHPIQGYLSLNGVDLRQINLQDWRNQIGLAGRIEWQHGTILENLQLDRDTVNVTDVIEVLKALGIWERISQFPQGLDTELTDHGAPMSQTELQRLMLARAMVAKPALVMIDGLLDGLEQPDLDRVLNVLQQRRAEWMVIITTRFNHIARQCDQVVDLNAYAVAEGAHHA